jgi:hypothetical protein
MATKADFSEEEWAALQKGLSGAGLLVSISEPGFGDTFKEVKALAGHLEAARERSESALIREIAATPASPPFGFTASADEVEQRTVESLKTAVAALEAKAPEEVASYRALVLDVAEAVADAAKGTSPAESSAIDAIRSALGG